MPTWAATARAARSLSPVSSTARRPSPVKNSKAPGQRLADRAAFWLVFIALLGGLATFAAWAIFSDEPLTMALLFAITVVVVTCPDALGLATPTAIMVGTGLGVRRGVLFKNAAALEASARIDTVVMDKTGTLTRGEPEVTDVVAVGIAEAELLALAAAVERASEHPLARAIVAHADTAGAGRRDAERFENVPGHGAVATVDGRRVAVGNRRLLDRDGVDPGQLTDLRERLAGAGRTTVLIAVDGHPAERGTASASRSATVWKPPPAAPDRTTGDRGCGRDADVFGRFRAYGLPVSTEVVPAGPFEERLRWLEVVTDTGLARLSVDELLDELLEKVRELMAVDTAAVLLLDPSHRFLIATVARGIEEEVHQGVRIPLGRGFAGRIAQIRHWVAIEQVDHHNVLNPILWEKGIASLLGVPLIAAGTLLGVLHVGTLTRRRFTEQDAELLQMVADRVATATQSRMFPGRPHGGRGDATPPAARPAPGDCRVGVRRPLCPRRQRPGGR